jgi:hypothetical protein
LETINNAGNKETISPINSSKKTFNVWKDDQFIILPGEESILGIKGDVDRKTLVRENINIDKEAETVDVLDGEISVIRFDGKSCILVAGFNFNLLKYELENNKIVKTYVFEDSMFKSINCIAIIGSFAVVGGDHILMGDQREYLQAFDIKKEKMIGEPVQTGVKTILFLEFWRKSSEELVLQVGGDIPDYLSGESTVFDVSRAIHEGMLTRTEGLWMDPIIKKQEKKIDCLEKKIENLEYIVEKKKRKIETLKKTKKKLLKKKNILQLENENLKHSNEKLKKNDKEYKKLNKKMIKKFNTEVKKNEELKLKFFEPFENFNQWQNEQNRKLRLREEVTNKLEHKLFEFHDFKKEVKKKFMKYKKQSKKALLYSHSVDKKIYKMYAERELNDHKKIRKLKQEKKHKKKGNTKLRKNQIFKNKKRIKMRYTKIREIINKIISELKYNIKECPLW